MAISMYQASIPGIIRILNSISGIIDKAVAHCEARKIDPSVLINYRLAPDMFPLARQIQIMTDQVKGMAGKFKVELKTYDDSTAAKGAWDEATCKSNATDHVANANEVAVLGTYNSGCAKLIVPVLNQDPKGPMLMVTHANSNPGLTVPWEDGEPDKYYPTGKRNYARVVAQGAMWGPLLGEPRQLKPREFVLRGSRGAANEIG